MGKNRRLARIATSDSEEDEATVAEALALRKKKKLKIAEEEEPEEEPEEEEEEEEEPEEEEESEEEEEPEEEASEEEEDKEEAPPEEAKPIGEVIQVTGKGRGKRDHFKAFEYEGNRFELEDSVLLSPEDEADKPYVAIIKEITRGRDGSLMVTGQWFYRPEEAERKGGGGWEPRDTRELFYSFHRDDVPAESVMHKCVAHFIPLNKKIPERKENPGFIVQKVYDTVEKKLWKLTDKDYEDIKQHEIDLLVQKTRERLGEFIDIEIDEAHKKNNTDGIDAAADQEEPLKNKRTLRRKNTLSLDVSRDDAASIRSDQHLTADTPGSCTSEVTEFYKILSTFKALTGDGVRDRWVEKVLEVVKPVFDANGDLQDTNKEKKGATCIDHNGGGTIRWPDAAVQAVVAVERAAHDTFSSDFQKYNQKMRSLVFNLKNSALLARRLVNGELEASVILHMTPNELKDGFTTKETGTKEPDESEHMQMTDAKCSRCSEKKVGLTDIIQAGGRGDRYQLECIACGNTWYAFRDEVSTLTIDAPSGAGNVGTAPWATAKFEDVEKKMVSPRGNEKSDQDPFKKSTEPYVPVLESQKSFSRPRAEASSTVNITK